MKVYGAKLFKKIMLGTVISCSLGNFIFADSIGITALTIPSGNVVTVWEDLASPTPAILASVQPFGTASSTPTNISGSGNQQCSKPQMVMDSAGNVVVVWTNVNLDTGESYIRSASLLNGSTWTEPMDVSEHNEFFISQIDLTMSPTGDCIAKWKALDQINTEQRIFRINYKSSTGNWGTPTTIQ